MKVSAEKTMKESKTTGKSMLVSKALGRWTNYDGDGEYFCCFEGQIILEKSNIPPRAPIKKARRLINMKKTGFDKIKEQLIREGWIEQECGTVYINGQYATNLYNKDESEVIHLSYNTFPDEELIDTLKSEG